MFNKTFNYEVDVFDFLIIFVDVYCTDCYEILNRLSLFAPNKL